MSGSPRPNPPHDAPGPATSQEEEEEEEEKEEEKEAPQVLFLAILSWCKDTSCAYSPWQFDVPVTLQFQFQQSKVYVNMKVPKIQVHRQSIGRSCCATETGFCRARRRSITGAGWSRQCRKTVWRYRCCSFSSRLSTSLLCTLSARSFLLLDR